MELDVLKIIREYSCPVTPPGWRNKKPMTGRRFHQAIARTYNRRYLDVIDSFVKRYDQIEFTYLYDYAYISRVRYNFTGYCDNTIKWPSRYASDDSLLHDGV